jgi:hypothetical protein
MATNTKALTRVSRRKSRIGNAPDGVRLLSKESTEVM